MLGSECVNFTGRYVNFFDTYAGRVCWVSRSLGGREDLAATSTETSRFALFFAAVVGATVLKMIPNWAFPPPISLRCFLPLRGLDCKS